MSKKTWRRKRRKKKGGEKDVNEERRNLQRVEKEERLVKEKELEYLD